MSHTTTQLLNYLKAGVTQSEAASALGITPSAVTQIIQSNPELSQELEKAREEQLSRSSTLDKKYDELELALLEQLHKVKALAMRPMEIAKILATVNAAKRRGVAASSEKPVQQTILNLNLPTTIKARFVVDGRNQVVQAGEQTLVTIPSASLPKLASRALPSLPNTSQSLSTPTQNSGDSNPSKQDGDSNEQSTQTPRHQFGIPWVAQYYCCPVTQTNDPTLSGWEDFKVN